MLIIEQCQVFSLDGLLSGDFECGAIALCFAHPEAPCLSMLSSLYGGICTTPLAEMIAATPFLTTISDEFLEFL